MRMRRIIGLIRASLTLSFAAIVIAAVVSGCDKTTPHPLLTTAQLPFASYSDIPGVTVEEIAAIETLRARYDHFVFGVDHSTEAFPLFSGQENEIGGYAALFCEWLTVLFGIPFRPTLYDWIDFFSEFENGDVHFTGNLTISEERKKTHFMTDSIAERLVSSFQIMGRPSIAEIAKSRSPRLAFMNGFAPFDYVREVVDYDFEPFFVSDYAEAYRVIKSGEVDAFLTMNIAEPAFNIYDDVVSETFYPLVFASAALSTRMADLEPVITVVQKALKNGGTHYLARLYSQGQHDYIKNKFFENLLPDELEYLQHNAVVKIATENDNYPLSFYNHNENELQGLVLDIMSELELITGLSFEIANTPDMRFRELTAMVEKGEASIVTVIIRTKERERSFLLPETPIMRDFSVLISKSEFPNIQFNELSDVMVGIVRGTMQAELFKRWFPNNRSYKEYDSMDSVFTALERGEVDMFMCMSNYLLSIENYKEIIGYKVNVAFDNYTDLVFGINKEEAVLCSIIDKALKLIDREAISGYWMSKRYDYRIKVVEAQLPWLIGAIILSLTVLSLILVMFFRNRNVGKRLAILVEEKTATITTASMRFKERAHWYESMLNAIPFPLSVTDAERKWTFVNTATCNFFGKELQDLVGKPCSNWNASICNTSDCGIVCVKRGLKQTRFSQEGLSYQVDIEILKGLEGEIIGFIEVVQDVTKLEQAIKQEAEAEAANRAKSTFLVTMSHEIRTPMNAILGITEILLQNELPVETRNALNIIYTSGYTLLDIINDLLDLSKIESGKLELINNRYETASLINDTINLNTARIGSKPIEFKLQVDEDMPFELLGDELRIKQILNNLLSNAIKYTDSGEVRLAISAQMIMRGSTSDVILAITVSDTGQGMTEEQVQTLFDAYSRFNVKENRFVEGTGLGMNIVQHLVEKMRGDISVNSVPGKGTEITLYLMQGYVGPAKLGSELAENLRSFRMAGTAKMKKAQIVREYMPYGRVLVVDDMETNLYVARGFLLPYGLTVNTALSGTEAVEKIGLGNVYDVVFMDHMMPVMDGIETAKAMRAKGYAHPIVALTANAVSGQADMFMASGFDGFISKPIDIRELNAALNKFVRDRQPAEVVEAARASGSGIAAGSEVPKVDPELARIFTHDAEKVIVALLEYVASDGSGDLQTYVMNVHSLKSALANIGEKKLSNIAKELEQAGKDGDTVFISEETPAFLSGLRALVDKLKSDKAEDGGEIREEDKAYLRKMLLIIKETCGEYDIDAAMAALTEIKQKQWPREYDELLDTISRYLLHSDFDEVEAVCTAYLSMV